MTPEQARQHVRHHEAAAERAERPDKRYQHLESARYLREKYRIPAPVIVRAVPATDFERLQTLHQPHVASKPDWKSTERYGR